LLRMEEKEHVLLLTMHHIVTDGWSMGVVVDEFRQLYEAYCQAGRSPLPELDVQYADYAIWQRKWLESGVMQQHLEYWRQHLAGVPVLELPTDYPRPTALSGQGENVAFHLSTELTDQLLALGRRQGVTLFMTLLSGFYVLLSRYSGQEDIAVGTVLANRNQIEIEKLVGFFVNTLVLRADLTGNPTFLELLDRVRSLALGGYQHQDLPFEKVVEDLQPERDLSRHPLFQVLVVLHNMEQEQLQLPELTIGRFDTRPNT